MNTAPTHIPHELIRASAGSGKTYQLTNRFIRLLYHGQSPERIIALTFTRKAAGEFFKGILTKLADASEDAKIAEKLGKEIEVPDARPDNFRAALRTLIESMGRLSLGTIDSFFRRILGLFPLEFGLGGEFEMMSEFEKQQARLNALETLLTHHGSRQSESDSLIKSFQLSNAGQDNRDFVGAFEGHLKNCHELLLRAPDPRHWGDPTHIWTGALPWVASSTNQKELVTNWRSHLEAGQSFSDEVQANWETIANHLAEWAPGKNIFAKSKTLMKRAVENLPLLESGEWEFVFRRKTYRPSPAFSKNLAKILKHCVSQELTAKLQRTQGIHGLLAMFEEHYNDQVRRQGRLTFADLPTLLAPGNGFSLLGGAEPDRLNLEYRLDGAYDHWLLDEFQDTSTRQWRVIANLIDEVAQDPDGSRTFFCVGDQKQSIYQWRGGDPKLLDRVETHYKQGDNFNIRSLNKIWRCCPEVLEMVNAVFSDIDILQQFDEQHTTSKRWSAIWKEHISANTNKGHSLYLTVSEKEERWPLVAHLLERIQPIANGLDCAILVQKNKTVREVVEYLRGALPDLPVIGESATNPGADNPLGAALLSLFRAAAHPADGFSVGHLRLTPLNSLLPQDPDKFADTMRQLQRDIHQRGFESVTREWITHLSPKLDDFGRWRAKQFLELARQFDETCSRNIDEFLRFIPTQEQAEVPGANMVQVLTIHKAKGLTFDVTIVPDLEGNRLDEPRKDALHIHPTDDGEVDWILDLPSQDICQIDSHLSDAFADARSEACYENLCKLYVALTRSRQGLYAITTAPRPKSTSKNYIHLLHETLATGDGQPYVEASSPTTKVFEYGDWGWIKKKKPRKVLPSHDRGKVATKRVHPRLTRHKPSSHGGMVLRGANLFDPHGADAAAFGQAVHSVFEQIEWCDGDTPTLLDKLQIDSPQAVEEVNRCLNSPEIAEVFQPDDKAEVWRERPFEIVIDGEFCSGVFDRVVLYEKYAKIIDFKTDRIDKKGLPEAVKRHKAQLELYRRALTRLSGLPETVITCLLVFTRPARVMKA